MMTVRAATLDDLDAVMALRREVAGEGRWIGAELPLDEEGDRASHAAGIERGSLFVAEADGELVGVIGLQLARFGVADLGMMVRDGFRGRGIGAALLERGITWAREQGAHKLALQHWPHNEAARALYERHGFVQEGYLRRHYPRKDGALWDAVVMGLQLEEEA